LFRKWLAFCHENSLKNTPQKSFLALKTPQKVLKFHVLPQNTNPANFYNQKYLRG